MANYERIFRSRRGGGDARPATELSAYVELLTLIQDKILVGLSAGLVGQPHETLIKEHLELPLKDTVKEKWLYGNAARLFRLE